MLALAAAAWFACASPVFTDGDNIRCAGGKAMRLLGIEAPEMPGSPKCRDRRRVRADCDAVRAFASRDHIRSLAHGHAVRCRGDAYDFYGRLLVECRAGATDLAAAQLAAGHAARYTDRR